MYRYLLLILFVAISYSQSYPLHFDGDGDYVQLPNLGDFTDDFTIEIIVRVDEIDGIEGLVSHQWWGQGGLHTDISSNGSWNASFHVGNDTHSATGGYHFPSNQEIFDTLTIASSKGNYLKIFYNGEEEDSFYHNQNLNIQDLVIGDQHFNDRYLNGVVSYVKISDNCRYHSSYNPDTNYMYLVDEHTLALYDFNSQDPETLFDISGNGNHGIIYGATRLVDGCTDEEACNFNSDATIDDGSCEYYSGSILHVSTDGSDLSGCGSEEYPFASIQYAIDNTANNDTVLVAPGIYPEQISRYGEDITIASWILTTGDESYIDETIIDGEGTHSCISLTNSDGLIKGFTLSDCYLSYGQGSSYNGGAAIWLHNSFPVIEDVKIFNATLSLTDSNNSHNGGAGIYVRISDNVYGRPPTTLNRVTLDGCKIIRNSGSCNEGDKLYGAGIYINSISGNNAIVELNDVTLSNNKFEFLDDGDECDLVMDENQDGYGILSVYDTYNVILNNVTINDGIAYMVLYINDISTIEIDTMNINNNEGYNIIYMGGGIGSDTIIRNLNANNNLATYALLYIDRSQNTLLIENTEITNNQIVYNNQSIESGNCEESSNEGHLIYSTVNSGWYDTIFKNVLIADNSQCHEGSIHITGYKNIYFINSTIADNHTYQNYPIYYINEFNNFTFINSILFNNTAYYYTHSSYLDPYEEEDFPSLNIINSVAYNCAGDFQYSGPITENNCYEFDPIFNDPENGDYTLSYYSPAIDAGTPNTGLDPDGTNPDLGYAYFDQSVNVVGCTDPDAQNYNPDANLDNGTCVSGPSVISIYDVPEDQGGHVFVNWNANSLDVLPNEDITHYSVLRYVPNERGWELLSEIPALYEDDYTYLAPTIQTSVPSEDVYYYTDYKVRAHTSEQSVFYDSEVVSGYSVDNVAPAVPLNFTAQETEEDFIYTWHYELEDDFNYHTFYSLNSDNINTLDTLITMSVIGEYDEHYATSIDIHSNESEGSDYVSTHSVHPGANLISFPILAEDTSPEVTLESLGSNGISIIGEGVAAQNLGNGLWVGSLSEVSHTSGYWVKSTSDDVLFLSGLRECEELSYNLNSGPNLKSYCCEQPGDLNLIPNECGAILGEGVAAQRVSDGWVGSLDQLYPGKGYWIKCSEEAQFNWECPE